MQNWSVERYNSISSFLVGSSPWLKLSYKCALHQLNLATYIGHLNDPKLYLPFPLFFQYLVGWINFKQDHFSALAIASFVIGHFLVLVSLYGDFPLHYLVDFVWVLTFIPTWVDNIIVECLWVPSILSYEHVSVKFYIVSYMFRFQGEILVAVNATINYFLPWKEPRFHPITIPFMSQTTTSIRPTTPRPHPRFTSAWWETLIWKPLVYTYKTNR